MARYYFHIKDGADLIKDPEGTELSTPDDARLQALRSARELWADAIKSGRELAADAVVIAELPDDAAVAKMALSLGAMGNVRTETLRAFTEGEFRKIVGELP